MSAVDDLIREFGNKHPFTWLSPEVVHLIEDAYEKGYADGR